MQANKRTLRGVRGDDTRPIACLAIKLALSSLFALAFWVRADPLGSMFLFGVVGILWCVRMNTSLSYFGSIVSVLPDSIVKEEFKFDLLIFFFML